MSQVMSMPGAGSKTSAVAWYRQRWPWILIAIPGTSVVLGFVLLYLAVTTWDGLVVDDYYRQGRAIDQTVARSALAARLGLSAEFDLESEKVVIRMSADEGVHLPPGVIVTIAHPTREGMDQILRLGGEAGVFAGPLAPLSGRRWLVQIEDEARTWRLNGAIRVPSERKVKILPYGT